MFLHRGTEERSWPSARPFQLCVAAAVLLQIGFALPDEFELERIHQCDNQGLFVDYTADALPNELPPCVTECPRFTEQVGRACAWPGVGTDETRLRLEFRYRCHDEECYWMRTGRNRDDWMQRVMMKLAQFFGVPLTDFQYGVLHFTVDTFPQPPELPSLERYYIARYDEDGWPLEEALSDEIGQAGSLGGGLSGGARVTGDRRLQRGVGAPGDTDTQTAADGEAAAPADVVELTDQLSGGFTEDYDCSLSRGHCMDCTQSSDLCLHSQPGGWTGYNCLEDAELFCLDPVWSPNMHQCCPGACAAVGADLADAPCTAAAENPDLAPGPFHLLHMAIRADSMRISVGGRAIRVFTVGQIGIINTFMGTDFTLHNVDAFARPRSTILWTGQQYREAFQFEGFELNADPYAVNSSLMEVDYAIGSVAGCDDPCWGVNEMNLPWGNSRCFDMCDCNGQRYCFKEDDAEIGDCIGETEICRYVEYGGIYVRAEFVNETANYSQMNQSELLINPTGEPPTTTTVFLPGYTCNNSDGITGGAGFPANASTFEGCRDACEASLVCSGFEYQYAQANPDLTQCFLVTPTAQQLEGWATVGLGVGIFCSRPIFTTRAPVSVRPTPAPLAVLEQDCLSHVVAEAESRGLSSRLGPCTADLNNEQCDDVGCAVMDVATTDPACYYDLCAGESAEFGTAPKLAGWGVICRDARLSAAALDLRWGLCSRNYTTGAPTTTRAPRNATVQLRGTSTPVPDWPLEPDAQEGTFILAFGGPLMAGVPLCCCIVVCMRVCYERYAQFQASPQKHFAEGYEGEEREGWDDDAEEEDRRERREGELKLPVPLPGSPDIVEQWPPAAPASNTEWWREPAVLQDFKGSAKGFIKAIEQTSGGQNPTFWRPPAKEGAPVVTMTPPPPPPGGPGSFQAPQGDPAGHAPDFSRTADAVLSWARSRNEPQTPAMALDVNSPSFTDGSVLSVVAERTEPRAEPYPIPSGLSRQLPGAAAGDSRTIAAVGGVFEGASDGPTSPHLLSLELMRLRVETSLPARRRFFMAQCLRWHPEKNTGNPLLAAKMFDLLQEKKAWFLSDSTADSLAGVEHI